MTQDRLDETTQAVGTRKFGDFPAKTDGGTGMMISPTEARFLVGWAKEYGLVAWLGHVCFMYGKPYVQIAGRIYNAHSTGEFRGYECYPMTDRRKREAGIPEDAWAWRAEVYRKGGEHPFVDYGVVTQEEVEKAKRDHGEKAGYLPIVKSPSLMAEKRALARALERAFPLGIPSAEEAGDRENSGG